MSTSKKSENGLAALVAMDALGVSPLPRNYEAFYLAVNGLNDALKQDLDALGSEPSQVDIDRVAASHIPERNAGRAVAAAHASLSASLSEFGKIVIGETEEIRDFASLVARAGNSIGSSGLSPHDILKLADKISVAARDRSERGSKAADLVESKSRELERVQDELEKFKALAITDPLTNIGNRRAFDEAMNLVDGFETDDARGDALILLDVDHFKSFNDTFGHAAGDKALTVVGLSVRRHSSRALVAARVGGEEFAVVLKAVTSEEAIEVAEGIRATVSSFPIQSKDGIVRRLTMSAGICMASVAANSDDMYRLADEALYESKTNGRDRCTVSPADATRKLAIA